MSKRAAGSSSLIPPEKIDLLTPPLSPKHDASSHSERCDECGNWISIGPSGIEYGHERGPGNNNAAPQCPRRPDCVDPVRPGPDFDGWVGPWHHRNGTDTGGDQG